MKKSESISTLSKPNVKQNSGWNRRWNLPAIMASTTRS